MGIASIDIDHADNESGPHVHGSISLQSLVPAAHGGAFDETGDGEWTPGVREWLVTVCISILVTMDAFNATVIIPLVPVRPHQRVWRVFALTSQDLSSALVQPLENTLWLNTAYLLASAASQALLAMLAEGLGHGPVLLAAVVLATVGTGVCGGSSGLPGLVAGRFIQGMGGGAITSISLLVIAETIPKTHQAQFTGYVFRAQVAGTVLGPVLGALFVEYAGDIWVFYSSFVFCALGMLVVPFAVDLRGYRPAYRGVSMQTLRAGDWVGGMLVFLSLGCLVSGVSWGGTQFAWDGWQTLVPICVGAVLGVLLVVYEAVQRTNGMVNTVVLRSVSVMMLHAGGFCHGVMISTHLQFLPIYLLLVQGLPATLVGLSVTSLTVLTPFFLLLLEKTPVFTSHTRIAPWLIRVGWIIDILSTGCCVVLDEATPTAAWVFVLLVAGVSHALLLPSYVVALQHTVPQYNPHRGGVHRSRKTDAPSALMAHSLLRTWGMCVGVSVGGCVFMNWVARSAGVHDGLVDHSGTQMRALRPWGEGDMTIIERGVYVEGLRMLWKVFTGVAGLGGLSSVFI
ncbi:major facilitator superfamily domain-containing protein [Aspergillus floccosus]